jgi:hypothetical protein
MNKNDFKSFYQIGFMNFSKRDFKAASKYLKACLKANSDYAPAWRVMGHILYTMENYKMAT